MFEPMLFYIFDYLFQSTEDQYSFFFFQAGDGIRYLYVTGVQTCALPIPPSSLSPLKQTRSAHASTLSWTIGSCARPKRSVAMRQPLPRSSTTAIPLSAPRRTSSWRGTEIGRASCRERGRMSMVPVSDDAK